MSTDLATTAEPSELEIHHGQSRHQLAQTLDDMRGQIDVLQKFIRDVMVKDQDYGTIPGTQRPTLYKPGAEKLCNLYRLATTIADADIDQNTESGFMRARVTVRLVHRDTGEIVAEGVGEANSKEGRYRWRNAERTCPVCGVAAIIKGKPEYGGGWVCFKRKDGCGAKFDADDPAILDQQAGRIENDDPWTLWNTILKMAKKRGHIDATLSATWTSGIFGQDAEDFHEWASETPAVPVEPVGDRERSPSGAPARHGPGPQPEAEAATSGWGSSAPQASEPPPPEPSSDEAGESPSRSAPAEEPGPSELTNLQALDPQRRMKVLERFKGTETGAERFLSAVAKKYKVSGVGDMDTEQLAALDTAITTGVVK